MQIQTKYNIGDTVWATIDNTIHSCIIAYITIQVKGEFNIYYIKYTVVNNGNVEVFSEDALYTSKQELMDDGDFMSKMS